MQIKGKSIFSSTTRKATKGGYPSNCYEVGLTDIEIVHTKDDKEKKWLESYLKEHLKDTDVTDKETGEVTTHKVLKIKNSKYEIPMFDMNAERLDKAVPLSNGTEITIEIEKRYSEQFKTDYLIVKAIQVNEPIKEFNPFK